MKKYYVEIVKYGGKNEVTERLGPTSYNRADKVDRGININLNHAKFFTRIVEEDGQ